MLLTLQAALFELENVLVETRAARAAALADAFGAEAGPLTSDALAALADGDADSVVAAAADALAPALDATARELVARRAELAGGRALAAGVSLAP
ncbi:hypothetical protein, partial [Roseisolibacter sp. H3M3-2]|uniref:hypothetical protein n=1 Tax=Roseisolibacter sp. H3M3-2 TaxID=3031323 RepID=UPI0023DA6195